MIKISKPFKRLDVDFFPDFGAGAMVTAFSSDSQGTMVGFTSFRAINLDGIGVFMVAVLAGVRLLADFMTLDAIGDDKSAGGVSILASRSTGVLLIKFSFGVSTVGSVFGET